MGRKIIGIIKPFSLLQDFYVYEDGNKITSKQLKIDEINEAIFSFMTNYNVTQLDLIGPKQYNKGLSKKIKEAEMTKFNKNTLKINIE